MIARKRKNRKARLEVRHAIRKSSEGARRLPEFGGGVRGLTLFFFFFDTAHKKNTSPTTIIVQPWKISNCVIRLEAVTAKKKI